MPEQVSIREVGPRDGFQNEPETIPLEDKVRLVEGLARTGLRRLEVTSFVRADVVPQLADGAELLRTARLPEEVAVSVLVPNERGLDAALPLREHFSEVNLFLSASETHNRENVNRSLAESLSGLERVIARALAEGLRCEGVISVSFGCPYEGAVPRERVLAIAERLGEAGCAEIAFGDTTGMANPAQVREFFAEAFRQLPGVELTAHFHNTRGQGLANALAALHTWRKTLGGKWVSPSHEGSKRFTREGGGAGKRERIRGTEYEYAVGAVDPEVAQKYVTAYNQTESSINSKKNEIANIKRDLQDTKKKKNRRPLLRRLRRAEGDLKALKKKQRGQRVGRKLGLMNKTAQRRIDSYQDEVLAATDRMSIAEQQNNPTEWRAAQGAKGRNLRTLIGLLQLAYDQAKPGPHKSQMRQELNAAKLDLATIPNESFTSAAAVDSLLTPAETEALQKIQADVAMAEAKLPAQFGPGVWKPYVPAGHPDEAKWALVGFWGSVLKRAMAAKNAPLIAQAAANYKSAKDAAAGAEDASGGAISQAEIYNAERFSLLRDFGGNIGALPGGAAPATFTPITGTVANPNAGPAPTDGLLVGQGAAAPGTPNTPGAIDNYKPGAKPTRAQKREVWAMDAKFAGKAGDPRSKLIAKYNRYTGRGVWTDKKGRLTNKKGKVIGSGSLDPDLNPGALGAGWALKNSPAPMSTASSARAAGATSPSAGAGGSYGGSGAGGSVTYKTVNQNNTFSAPPPDPHTWSRSTNYELETAV